MEMLLSGDFAATPSMKPLTAVFSASIFFWYVPANGSSIEPETSSTRAMSKGTVVVLVVVLPVAHASMEMV